MQDSERYFKKLQTSLSTARTTPDAETRWMLAAIALLCRDDMFVSSQVIPWLQDQPNFLQWILGHLEEQGPTSFVSLRLLATLLLLTSKDVTNPTHRLVACRGSEVLAVLFALLKTEDPLMTPHLMIALQCLAIGPSARDFALSVACDIGTDAVRVALSLCKAAKQRSTGIALFKTLFETKEGSRLCRALEKEIEPVLIGTHLEQEWRMMRRV